MGGAFPRKYTDEQRDAIAHAWAHLNIRPAERIARLAAAGELTNAGELVPAFHVPAQTVRDIGARYLRRRAGLERSKLAELEPRDAVERLRRRLVSVAEHELDSIERAQARKAPIAPERVRGMVRVVRELAALPGLETPPLAPAPEKGKHDTRGGLAGAILRAARASGAPERVNGSAEDPASDALARARDRPPTHDRRDTDDTHGGAERVNAAHEKETADAPATTHARDPLADVPSV